MNCDGVSGLLSAYVDGELSAGELLRVEQHLRRCHACADEVDSLRQTIALVSSLEEVEVPADFRVRLHDRLVAMGPPSAAVRRTPAAPSWQRNVRRWAVPAAAAAAALAIGLTSMKDVQDILPPGLTGPGTMEVSDPVALGPGEQVNVPDPGNDAPVPPPVQGTGPIASNGEGGQTNTTDPGRPNPGQSDPNSATVTVPGNPGTPELAESRITFAGTVTATAADPTQTLAALQAAYPDSSLNGSTLEIVLSAQDYERTKSDILKRLPGAVWKDTQKDYGTEYAQAKDKADQADTEVVQAREKVSASGSAADQAELKAAEDQAAAAHEDLKRIELVLNKATITITVAAPAQ